MTGRAVAVFGGTGWLGRHVCAELASRGREVVAVARTPAAETGGARFVALDLARCDAAALAGLLRGHRVGTVVNATDAANATDGWDRPEDAFTATNVTLVHRLVSAAGDLPWPLRIAHVGTIHEYGPVPRDTVIDEAVRPAPANPYTRTKLAGSEAVLAAARAGRVEGTVLRSANIIGPHPSPRSFPGELVRRAREALESGGELRVAVDASRRDFVDVRDVADAVARAALAPATGEAVTIGRGEAVEIAGLVDLFVRTIGFPRERLRVERARVPSLGGDWTLAGTARAARLLGWAPRISLADSIRAMWAAARPPGR